MLGWSEFRELVDSVRIWQSVDRNNKEIRIHKKPVYYKNYFEYGVVYTHDLLFDLSITDSYSHLSNKVNKTNFLQWEGLRHSIPSSLKVSSSSSSLRIICPSFLIGKTIFDVKKKNSNDYYSKLVQKTLKTSSLVSFKSCKENLILLLIN